MKLSGHLAVILGLASPALAVPPPPIPHARYGPVTQCLGGYAFAVGPSEAILVFNEGMSLVTPDYLINLSLEQPDPYRQWKPVAEFDDPRLGHIVRYQWGEGEHARIENRLPRLAGEPTVIVRSSVAQERTAFTRIEVAGRRGIECGNFNGPEFPGEESDARSWAPRYIPGPLYGCEQRVGYELQPGEGVREPWPHWSDYTPRRVVLRDANLTVHGPYRAPEGFAGPVAAGYRMSVQARYDGPVLFLSPPRSFLRRQPREERPDYVFRIEFNRGDEAAAREFATRLEFVESDDPRCTANRERP
jgi:hypothetical protein